MCVPEKRATHSRNAGPELDQTGRSIDEFAQIWPSRRRLGPEMARDRSNLIDFGPNLTQPSGNVDRNLYLLARIDPAFGLNRANWQTSATLGRELTEFGSHSADVGTGSQ